MKILNLMIAVSLAAATDAHADDQEWHVSVAAGGAMATMTVDGAATTSPVPGGRLRVAYGLTNALELGGGIGLGVRPSLVVAGASLDGQDGTLYGDLYLGDVLVDLRWYAGVGLAKCFERVHPFIGVGAGLTVRHLRAPALYDTGGGLVIEGPAEWAVSPAVAAEVGVDYRLAATFALGAEVVLMSAKNNTASGGVVFFVSWRWY